jgi:hypothetical protein
MKRVVFLWFWASLVSAQQIAPHNIQPSPTNGQVLTTQSGTVQWANPPSGGGNPGGAVTSCQLNASGTFGGDLAGCNINQTSHRMQSYNFGEKTPRVDVTHTDFSGGADPTGTNDSTPAFSAAVAFACGQPTEANATNTLYVPAGIYKINSGEIRITCPLRIMGDGPEATTLWLTNATSNLLTVNYSGSAPCSISGQSGYCGFALENIKLAGNGHLTTGTLLELDHNITFWKIRNVVMVNHGGRAFTPNNSERGQSENLYIYDVRLPLVLAYNSNEVGFMNTRVQGGETESGNYSYNVNAVNGVFPAANSAVCANYPAWQANTQYPTGTIICDGINLERASSSGFVNSAGTAYTIGTSGATVPTWNGTVGGTTADNGGGTGGASGVTWTNEGLRYPLKPDYHASVYVDGPVVFNWSNGSIKSLQHTGGIVFFAGEAESMRNTYFECFTGKCINPSVQIDAPPEKFPLTSGISSSALSAPAGNIAWALNYYNNPGDAQAVGSGEAVTYNIYPPDYDINSSAPSTCGGGILQNTVETVSLQAFSGDGNVYLRARGQNSTTARAWCSGSYLASVPIAAHGGVYLENNHFHGTGLTESGGYTSTCGDQLLSSVCKEVLLGPVWDGKLIPYSGNGTVNFAFLKQLYLSQNSFFTDANTGESVGQGYIGCIYSCVILDATAVKVNASVQTTALSTLQNYTYGGGYMYQAIYSPFSAPFMDFSTTNGIHLHTGQPYTDSISNINQGGSNFATYHQFENEYCTTDIQSGTQPFVRHCYKGGPNAFAGYGEETDVWNGTSWVNLWGIVMSNAGTGSASGSLTGSLSAGLLYTTSSPTLTGNWLFNSAGTSFQNGSGQNLLNFYSDGTHIYDNMQCVNRNSASSGTPSVFCTPYQFYSYWNGTAAVNADLRWPLLFAGGSVPTQVTLKPTFDSNTLPTALDLTNFNNTQVQQITSNTTVVGQTGVGPTSSILWTTGNTTPTGSCTSGSLYTYQGGTQNTALYVCIGSAWFALPTIVPPTNTGSGWYTQIGPVIMQWGETAQFNTGPITLTFPISFSDTTYQVEVTNDKLNCGDGNDRIWSALDQGKTASTINITNSGTGCGHWFAIGH